MLLFNRKYNIVGAIVFLFSVILPVSLRAQYFRSGTETQWVKWKTIKSGKIRMIFPSDAQRIVPEYLNYLCRYDSLVGLDYGLGATPIDIVLHNHSSLSNGFVAWAPRRAELIAQPPVRSEPLCWSQQLAVHELRHVKQLYALNRATVKWGTFLFGQQAVGLAAALVPPWFFEGDAVYAETRYTPAGRGRSARFLHHYRATLASGTNYSYDKWLLGSYRDFIPNHYAFGYMLVSYGYQKYGTDIWNKSMQFAARYPFSFFPFYFGVKRVSGLSRKNLALAAISYRDSVWAKCNRLNKPTYIDEEQLVARSLKTYTNFTYSYPVDDSTLLVYRESLDDIPAFIRIDLRDSTEHPLARPGRLLGPPAYSGNRIAWAEYLPHPRWEYSSKTRIRFTGVRSDYHRSITLNGRYFSPVFVENESLLAFHYSDSGIFSLVRIGNGSVDTLYRFPYSIEPKEMAFDSLNRKLYLLAVTPDGKAICRLEHFNVFDTLVPPSYTDIRNLSLSDDGILYFGINTRKAEKIYSFNPVTGMFKTYAIGSIDPAYPVSKNGMLYYSKYTKYGYRVYRTLIAKLPVEEIGSLPEPSTDSLSINNNSRNSRNNDADISSVTSYNGLHTLFHFHSYFPFYFDPQERDFESSVYPGLTLISQNLTGSAVSTLAYGYGDSHLYKATFGYYGFWPVLKFSFERFNRNAALFSILGYPYTPGDKRWKLKLDVSLPINLGKGAYYARIEPYINTQRTNDYLLDHSLGVYRSGLTLINTGLFFYMLRHQAHRDMLPRYGILFKGEHIVAPFSLDNLGSITFFQLRTFLPGVLSNHSFSISLMQQTQHLKWFYFTNRVTFPRGYADAPSKRYSGISSDYIFPFLYPDLPIRSLVYVKRLSFDLFYDTGYNTYLKRQGNGYIEQTDRLRSVGLALRIDFNLFRTRYPFRIIFRQAYLGNQFTPAFKVSLGMDLFASNYSLRN